MAKTPAPTRLLPADAELPTPRQRECIRAIHRLTRKLHRPPSFQELGDELELTKAGAATLVRYCAAKGFVEQHREVVELHVTDEGKRWL